MRHRDERSKCVFDFICRYTEEHGFPPTLQEIAKDQDFRSNSGVIRHLDKLERWGWIERWHGNARGIRLLRRCAEPAPPAKDRGIPSRRLIRRR